MVPTLNVSLEYQLIRYQGVPQPPRAIADYGILLYLNPLKWRIQSEHFYYAGPHCAWKIGPLGFRKSGLGPCLKCKGETS